MGEKVKKEVEDGDLLAKTLPQQPDDDVTLAQLSLCPSSSPTPPSPASLPGKKNNSMELIGKRVKIKRRYTDSKAKHGMLLHGGNCIWQNKSGGGLEGMSTPGEAKSSAMIRAEEVQSNLEPLLPSFIKSLVRSHVGSCFWMGLPGPFCRAHLPHEDTTITLEDECAKGYRMRYIAYKTGLSAGWRQFCVAHQLLEGDVLVFQLIEPCKFKVYIIRANDLTEVDGALGLLNLDAQTKQNDAEEEAEQAEIFAADLKNTKRKRPKSLPLAAVQKKNKKSSKPRSGFKHVKTSEQSENDSEEVASEVLEGYKLSLPAIQFEDVESFENFSIIIDGLVLDSELSEDVRSKYYKLCCSQNAFLHDKLIKCINFKLIAGIISETVNIADAIKASNLTTSRDEFATWDKTLKASELFGMNVGFLRARLKKLMSLAFDSDGATKTRKYIEARNERAHTEDEIRNLEAKLAQLRAAYERYGADIESIKSKAESYELKFQEEVLAPW